MVKAVGTSVAPGRLRALYFTRARAPWGDGELLHHIGLYAYRRGALERFRLDAALAARAARKARATAGARGRHADRRLIVDAAPLGVDTPEDLERARAILGRRESLMTETRSIAYQGEPGANSHIACIDNYPDLTPLPCATFEDAFAALQDGTADLGMIPIENSIAGRVADIHTLLPASGLHIVGETFLPIHFQLLAVPGRAGRRPEDRP